MRSIDGKGKKCGIAVIFYAKFMYLHAKFGEGPP